MTATDTGVGKTVVTAALAVALRKRGYSVGVMKPAETGVVSESESDAGRLKRAALVHDDLALIRPYAFRQPVAPLDAARMAKRPLQVSTLRKAYRTLRARHDLLLVEGIGGLHVPLARTVDVLDLIEELKTPVVVLGRASLGGVNHALLTLHALRQRKIPIVALVLNHTCSLKTAVAQGQARSTVRLLRQRAGVPVIGPLPYRSGLRRHFHREVTRLAGTAAITKLMKLVLASGRGTLSRRGGYPGS